jgi:hypothetical protein
MLDVRGFTYGFALGLSSMYLWDPDRGGTRRARIRDTSKRVVRDAQHAVQMGTRDLENRSRGMGARTRAALSGAERELSEDVLVARVRSKLGRVTTHAHAIEVRLKEGNEIELKGPALASEHDRIVRAASRVRGVDSIDDDLVVYQEADGIPGLQGGEAGEEGREGEAAAQTTLPLPRTPGTRLLLGAAMTVLLVSPLAPAFVRTIFSMTIRTLVHDASPQILHRLAERLRAETAEARATGCRGREAHVGGEPAAYPM